MGGVYIKEGGPQGTYLPEKICYLRKTDGFSKEDMFRSNASILFLFFLNRNPFSHTCPCYP